MKEKIVYIVSFLLAFVIVTGLIIYLNSTFKNIFAFDFSSDTSSVIETKEPAEPGSVTPGDSTQPKATQSDIPNAIIDTAQIKEATAVQKDTSLSAAAGKIIGEIKPENSNDPVNLAESAKKTLAENNKAKQDSSYVEWIKNTVKLYESMETQKAAKIILGYSDNIARDILLKMKKKKAAEILAEFKPEIATRIISVVQ
ncbi:MAG: hypothetical protein CVV24_02280 [Ignavibacteriae bacterium HGW-Ignavibacteriae-3]|nr:MAG: hypothetical protein CVV24_02280 [Ignavibacteriae bacterium HGW-Ignavibacteriae-3]